MLVGLRYARLGALGVADLEEGALTSITFNIG